MTATATPVFTVDQLLLALVLGFLIGAALSAGVILRLTTYEIKFWSRRLEPQIVEHIPIDDLCACGDPDCPYFPASLLKKE